MNVIEVVEVPSPIGAWTAVVHDGRLLSLSMSPHLSQMLSRLEPRLAPMRIVRRRDPGGVGTALRRYFRGDVAAIDTLLVDVKGTPFQLKAWRALRAIPAGRRTSYSTLARRIGSPAAARAVGHANAVNPVAIVVPCHRVVALGGALHGYAYGLDRKRWLLEHEARHARM